MVSDLDIRWIEYEKNIELCKKNYQKIPLDLDFVPVKKFIDMWIKM